MLTPKQYKQNLIKHLGWVSPTLLKEYADAYAKEMERQNAAANAGKFDVYREDPKCKSCKGEGKK